MTTEKRRMRWRMVEAKRREEYGGGRRGTRGNEQGRRVGRGGEGVRVGKVANG